MSSISFLIADVIQCASSTMTTFSQGDGLTLPGVIQLYVYDCLLAKRSALNTAVVCEHSLKTDFLSSQKPLAAKQRVLSSFQNNFQSLHRCENLFSIGLTGVSNRGSLLKLLRSLHDLLNMTIFS